MSEYLEILRNIIVEPFFVRAFIGGLLISMMTAVVGIFIVLRKESFIADGIAHASLTGVAIGLLASLNPTMVALAVGILMSLIVVYVKRSKNVSSDAAIGASYPFLFSIGILLLFIRGRYSRELETYIFGNVVTTSLNDIILLCVVFLALIFFFSQNYKKMLLATLSEDIAKTSGINVSLLDYAFTILTSFVVIAAVKVVGIILVTAFLVVPVLHARVYAKKFSDMLPIAVTHNLISFLIGIFISLNYPPGASIVLVSCSIYFIGSFLKGFWAKK